MKTLKSIPVTQRNHFMKCECGEYFDMRNLKDVMRHFHKSKDLAQSANYSHSIKVGEPHIYTKSKRKITIN
jgi:uncharacterized C2H2 Zn-finger protein